MNTATDVENARISLSFRRIPGAFNLQRIDSGHDAVFKNLQCKNLHVDFFSKTIVAQKQLPSGNVLPREIFSKFSNHICYVFLLKTFPIRLFAAHFPSKRTFAPRNQSVHRPIGEKETV